MVAIKSDFILTRFVKCNASKNTEYIPVGALPSGFEIYTFLTTTFLIIFPLFSNPTIIIET